MKINLIEMQSNLKQFDKSLPQSISDLSNFIKRKPRQLNLVIFLIIKGLKMFINNSPPIIL